MDDRQQREAAKQFSEYWKEKGYEKGESQSFWLSLLRDVYGVDHPEQFINFEEQVHLDHTSFIDGVIPATKVLIEQRSAKTNQTIRRHSINAFPTGKKIYYRTACIATSSLGCNLQFQYISCI